MGLIIRLEKEPHYSGKLKCVMGWHMFDVRHEVIGGVYENVCHDDWRLGAVCPHCLKLGIKGMRARLRDLARVIKELAYKPVTVCPSYEEWAAAELDPAIRSGIPYGMKSAGMKLSRRSRRVK